MTEQGIGSQQNSALVRGGMWFLGGLFISGVALLAQALLLHEVAGKKGV
jgi:hypothetical protein